MDSIKATLVTFLFSFFTGGDLAYNLIKWCVIVLALLFWMARNRREVNEFYGGSFWEYFKSIFK